MLSIKPIGSSSGEIGYYTQLGQEDYYLSGGEPPGTWWGGGAKVLTCSSAVDNHQFGQLLRGILPATGEALVQNANDPQRRSAFDLTFTVPKSVSVAWALAGMDMRREIELATESSVHRTLEVVQDYCGIARRGRQGEKREEAQLTAALFRHDTARAVGDEAPDPNLHIHCVLLNLVVRPDGSTGALDARELFRPHMKMALGALFRAQLATELSRLGLQSVRPLRDGKPVSWFELRDVPEELIRVFSKRRGQIEAWLDERGLSGALAAELAANKTRSDKQPWKREELLDAWQREAEPFRFQVERIARVDDAPKPPRHSDRIGHAQDAIAEITDHSSHFTEVYCLRQLAQKVQTLGYKIAQIRDDLRNLFTRKNKIVPLSPVRNQIRYTTPEMLEIEQRLLRIVAEGKGLWEPRMTERQLRARLGQLSTLRPEQSKAASHIVSGIDRVACVNGMAGTGKTFLLGVANQLWKESGYQVLGTALAAKAACGLEEGSRITSIHLHSLLNQIDAQSIVLTPQSILVVDEAGMIGTRMMDRLVRLTANAGSKLVLVGDHRQLQAIEAGGPFGAIAHLLGAAHLSEITRQQDQWARDAVHEFAQGDAAEALSSYIDRGLLSISETRVSAMRELVSDWSRDFQHGWQTLIFSAMRSETQLLNRFCQHELQSAGLLEGEFVELGKEQIFSGDRVVFTRNNNRLLVRNGTGGRVASVDPQKAQLVVDLDTGYRITVDLNSFNHLALGYAVTVHKGQGQTVDTAFVLAGGPMTDRELSYVQASRAREKTRFYCDADSAGDHLGRLIRQMENSRKKDLAIEHLMEVQ